METRKHNAKQTDQQRHPRNKNLHEDKQNENKTV